MAIATIFGTTLSRRSSIFLCNRHQIDFYNDIRHDMINRSTLPRRKYLCNFEEKNRRL